MQRLSRLFSSQRSPGPTISVLAQSSSTMYLSLHGVSASVDRLEKTASAAPKHQTRRKVLESAADSVFVSDNNIVKSMDGSQSAVFLTATNQIGGFTTKCSAIDTCTLCNTTQYDTTTCASMLCNIQLEKHTNKLMKPSVANIQEALDGNMKSEKDIYAVVNRKKPHDLSVLTFSNRIAKLNDTESGKIFCF